MKIAYIDKNFSERSLTIIGQANAIIDEYRAAGYTLILRQLYYQFVARDLIANKQSEYKRLGNIINDARLAGLIDWSAIEDRTRNLQFVQSWDDPQEIIDACAHSYHVDLWEGQAYRPEVWIEKEALVGVIEGVCNELDVPFFACRGYTSQSEQWRAGHGRLRKYADNGQTPVILHFGDHDPSGIDMTRDNQVRLTMFLQDNVEVRRLALNMDQVDEHQPPPNPAKFTDSRYESYVTKYGEESWELDALEPDLIAGLIRNEVEGLRDDDLYNEKLDRQEYERGLLNKLKDNWDEVPK